MAATSSEPLLPGLQEDRHADKAEARMSRERRFRWLRVGIISTAGLLGPLLVLLLGSSLGLTGSKPCEPCPPDAVTPPALLSGGNQSFPDFLGSPINGSTARVTELPLSLGADLPWLQDQARGLLRAWGLGSRLKFAQLADEEDSIESVLDDASAYSTAAAIVFVSGPQPLRRGAGQAYITVAEGSKDLWDVFPAGAVNSAASLLERGLHRRLFPLTLQEADFKKSNVSQPPFALIDLSSGRIIMDAWVVQQVKSFAGHGLTDSLGTFADSLFSQLARVANIKDRAGLSEVAQMVLRAAVSAVGIAIAYQVPLWYCVACPAVLGLLAPLVINGGLGAIAQYACDHWKLHPDECADLWYGAFAAGMVLSLASAVPIVFICKLPQCARRH